MVQGLVAVPSLDILYHNLLEGLVALDGTVNRTPAIIFVVLPFLSRLKYLELRIEL